MGKASSKHKVDKPELVLELFKKAGHTHHIKPGHVLIEQGKESESLFLVVSGELVLKRGTKELARRGVGQLLGEMSFLLGSKPGVTVVAEAPVTIVELQQSKVLRVLQHDPQLAAQVFRSLAVTLSERVKERSAALRTEVNEAHQPAHTHVAELTSPLEASPRELAKKFGLAASTALIIHCDCSVFFEQNSQRDQDEHPATLYLFETHLCLDVSSVVPACSTIGRGLPLPSLASGSRKWSRVFPFCIGCLLTGLVIRSCKYATLESGFGGAGLKVFFPESCTLAMADTPASYKYRCSRLLMSLFSHM